MSNIQNVTLERLSEYLAETAQPRGIEKVVLHHTWKPTAAQYNDKLTWQSIRNYHLQDCGWSDIGYHLGVGPDSSVWLLRPIERAGAHCKGQNADSIGVVMIGNFDEEDPEQGGVGMAARVVAAVCDQYGLLPSQVYGHCQFSRKTCPGLRIDMDEFRGYVRMAMLGFGGFAPAGNPDVSPWAQPEVDWAVDNQIMTRNAEGLFRGQDNVARQELAVVAYRLKDHLWNLFYERTD